MFKKLRLSLTTILFLAVLAGMAILLWGEEFGLETSEARAQWLSIIAIGAILVCLLGYLDFWTRWAAGFQNLKERLKLHWAGNTTMVPLAMASRNRSNTSDPTSLVSLPGYLRQLYGRNARYRQPWLLLTGDDDVIASFLPALRERSWLVTPDAVLLWSKSSVLGEPDHDWLRQLRTLRRRRPVDMVVLVGNSASLLQRRQHDHAGSALLARTAQGLQWRTPVVVLELHGQDQHHAGTTAVGAEWDSSANAEQIKERLLILRDRLASIAVSQLSVDPGDKYLGELSQRLDERSHALSTWIAGLQQGRGHDGISGVFFAAYPASSEDAYASSPQQLSGAESVLWQRLAKTVRLRTGRRVGWHPETVLSVLALGSLGIWTAGMLVSAATNGRDIAALRQTVMQVTDAPSSDDRLRGLLDLQQQIIRYQYRIAHRAPVESRFGLNRDIPILNALWLPYRHASQQMLVLPVQQALEGELIALAQLRSDQLDQEAGRYALDGQLSLKTYLMLAEPPRSDALFLKPQLLQRWQLETQLAPGVQVDLAGRLLGFYSEQLAAHPDWRITPSLELVAAARQTLRTAIGVEQADTTLYRKILAGAADKYPDQTLTSLTQGIDPRGLIRNHAVVAGVFTRQAYEGTIAAAIAEAAKRHAVVGEVGDWVLSTAAATTTTTTTAATTADAAAQAPEQLEAALTAQYFADYAEQWQGFMNNTLWASATTLPAAIEQLKLMSDAHQSPVIALMKALQYQAGAGARQATLSATLVAKAQNLMSSKNLSALPSLSSLPPDSAGPLASSFGPVLRLLGEVDTQTGSTAATAVPDRNELSLQRYLNRVSALRLRLQQLNSSSDTEAQSKQLVLSMFQGKGSELADTQDYAHLVAASLGEQWAGLGDALFVRPVAQAIQTLLLPAQTGMNEAWQRGVVTPWHRAFTARYPFVETNNDASFPELARFLRPQTGLIAGFLHAQLPGVLELQGDQWVANPASKLNFDPDFLRAINLLQRVGGRLLLQGEPQYRFELKPMPTAGITDTVLTVDAQKLHYYNQHESWQQVRWPVNQIQDAGTRLQWQTEQAGTNKQYEFTGRWALVRMLERARVEPIDSATFQLTWLATAETTALGPQRAEADRFAQEIDADHLLPSGPMIPAPAEIAYPLTYQMRTEAGRGPLELLSLRDFALPSRIFSIPSRSTSLTN